MANEILTARKGPVLEITLNRPEIGNAASDAMAVELTRLLLGAGESSEIVVLRGAGDDFCVGRETMGKRPPGQQPDALELRRRNDVVFNCYGAFRRCEIPVIGVCKGARSASAAPSRRSATSRSRPTAPSSRCRRWRTTSCRPW